jgi:single-strand DNA-binding protein
MREHVVNVVILRGRLSRPPESRVLPSGTPVVAFDVTTQRPGERAETVPVSWFDAPASVVELEVDTEVVVTGRVRRRFFRAGGTTQSRTEVTAACVVPARQAKRVQKAVDAALAEVAGGDEGEVVPLSA